MKKQLAFFFSIIIVFQSYAQIKNDVTGFLGIDWGSSIEITDKILEKRNFEYTKDYRGGDKGPFEFKGEFANYPAILQIFFEYDSNGKSYFNKAVIFLEPPRGQLNNSYEQVVRDLEYVYGKPNYSIREQNEEYKDIELAILFDEVKYETMWEFKTKNKIICFLSRYNKYYYKIAIAYIQNSDVMKNDSVNRLLDY